MYSAGQKRPRLPNGYRAIYGMPKRGGKRPYLFDLDWIIITNPDLKVEIVQGLDTQCLGDDKYLPCLKRESIDNCKDEMDDAFCLKEYRLTVGQIVRSKDLIQILADYKLRTGYDCPREKQDA